MRIDARSPEELEALFEDALILGDRAAVLAMFHAQAVLVAEPEMVEARGPEEIARLVKAIRDRGCVYVADPRQIVQASDTTLVVAQDAINVIRRGSDGSWRYVISLLNTHNEGETDD